MRALALLGAVTVLGLSPLACGGQDRAAPSDTQTETAAPVPSASEAAGPSAAETSAPASSVLWSADFEEASVVDLYYPAREDEPDKGGGIYNSGRHEARASSELAHSGRQSLRARIWTGEDSTSAVRLFRWREAREHRELYYSAWFFIPTDHRRTADPSAGAFWNLFQFKTRSSDGRNDPVWALYVNRNDDGEPYLRAGWGWGGTELAGPFESSSQGGRFFEQSVATLPIGRWFQLEAFLRQSKDFDGRLTIWQDGEELYDFTDVRTSYPYATADQSWGANNEWSVNNYADGLSPSPATIYIDDAEIRR